MKRLPLPCDATPEGQRECRAVVAEPLDDVTMLDPTGQVSLCRHCGYVVELTRVRLRSDVVALWMHLYPPGAAYAVTLECVPWRTLSVSQPDVDWTVPLPPHRGGWRPAHLPRLSWMPTTPQGAHR